MRLVIQACGRFPGFQIEPNLARGRLSRLLQFFLGQIGGAGVPSVGSPLDDRRVPFHAGFQADRLAAGRFERCPIGQLDRVGLRQRRARLLGIDRDQSEHVRLVLLLRRRYGDQPLAADDERPADSFRAPKLLAGVELEYVEERAAD